jgi:uridine monophosphate synthetase
MVFKRKEAKTHGTKKCVEGDYKSNDKCLVVDDVITSGVSILETVQGLREGELQVSHALVLLDREQGGPENLVKENIQVIRYARYFFL